MGVCDSNNGNTKMTNYPGIQHIQVTGNPELHSYRFNFPDKNIYSKRKYNLKFIFYNFKVKYCISHKQTRDSTYITEIIIGQKTFPIIVNQGQSPNIQNQDDIKNGYFEQKEYTLEELEKAYLFINIYEILDDISDSIEELGNGIPEAFKQKSKYHSFFRINLLSFLFKSQKCDFPMMGTNQLSTKTRISFYCFIEHKEKIGIKAQALNNHLDYKNLVFRLNNKPINCLTKQPDNSFILSTPPITMLELQRGDLYLETAEDYDNYQYISFNDLKADIIKQLGLNILKEENNFYLNNHQPVNINDINNINDHINNQNIINNYQNNKIIQNQLAKNDKASLIFQDLPIITQFYNSYFTEYGNIYSTSLLNLINNDPELHNYRKSKNIASENFYEKLYGYSKEISETNDLNIISEIHVLLMRSIENDKFMFIYPTMDDLNQMVILFMIVGLKIIEIIRKTNEESKLFSLTKLINLLMKREELDNGVLYECMNKYKGTNDDPKDLYNKLIKELFYLYELLLSNKLSTDNDVSLIELFSRLYFQKSIFRKAILYTLTRQNEKFNNNDELFNNNNNYLYDIINDEKLNKYLYKDTNKILRNFINNKDYFNNITFDSYRLLKKIISFMNNININQYPFDFTLFNDNVMILDIIEKDINLYKYEKKVLSNDFYESLMLLSNSFVSISHINKTLIRATNGHKPYAVYTLFIYFKSLFDYYKQTQNSKLIMDYSVFELASQLLAQNEDSVSLPRLFWFYYSCSDVILTPNLKWFIVNIINKNFDKFAFHWSFTIRQVFFKLAIFILYDKLQNEEGKLFRREKLTSFINKSINNPNNIYTKEACKDFDCIYNEYKYWLERKKVDSSEECPIFFLPAPLANNGTID